MHPVALPLLLYTVVCIILCHIVTVGARGKLRTHCLLLLSQYLAEQIKMGCVNSSVFSPGDEHSPWNRDPEVPYSSCLVCTPAQMCLIWHDIIISSLNLPLVTYYLFVLTYEVFFVCRRMFGEIYGVLLFSSTKQCPGEFKASVGFFSNRKVF